MSVDVNQRFVISLQNLFVSQLQKYHM